MAPTNFMAVISGGIAPKIKNLKLKREKKNGKKLWLRAECVTSVTSATHIGTSISVVLYGVVYRCTQKMNYFSDSAVQWYVMGK